MLTLLVLHVTKDIRKVFFFYAPWHMCLAAGFLAVSGSIEGDITIFMNTPVAAAVIPGRRKSLAFFAVCVLVVVAFPAIDGMLPIITWDMAISAVNPEGLVFHSPQKRPITPGESIAFTSGIVLLYVFVRANTNELLRANSVIASQQAELEKEHARSEGLLKAILPDVIVQRLKRADHETIADDLPEVTVLFADIVGFTPMAAATSRPRKGLNLICV